MMPVSIQNHLTIFMDNCLFKCVFVFMCVLCVLQGELQAPLASICVPQVMDHQQFQEGLAEFTSHNIQPVSSTQPNRFSFQPIQHETE